MPMCPRKSCARKHGREMLFEAAPSRKAGAPCYEEALWNGPVVRRASGSCAGEAGTRTGVIAAQAGPCPAHLLAQQMLVRGCLRQAQERGVQDTLLLFPALPQEPQPSHQHLPGVNARMLERSRKKLISL